MKVTVELPDEALDDIVAQQLLEMISNLYHLIKKVGDGDKVDMLYDLAQLKGAYRFCTVEGQWSKLDEYSC